MLRDDFAAATAAAATSAVNGLTNDDVVRTRPRPRPRLLTAPLGERNVGR